MRTTNHMVEGIRDENGWTFASDLSPERLAELQGLVAANGLSSAVGATGDAGEEAFARMVASNPNATVVGGPAGSAETSDLSAPSAGLLGGGSWVFSSDLSAESLAQVIPNPSPGPNPNPNPNPNPSPNPSPNPDPNPNQVQGMIAMNGLPSGSGPAAGVVDDAAARAERAAAGDAAFARMVAGNPNATVIGASPSANGGGAPGSEAAGEGLEGDPSSAAGEAAFAALLAANPGAKEVAPGVYMTGHDEPPAA